VIEVFLIGNRWAWRFIAACGRELLRSSETFPCDFSANDAAKRYRREFFAAAELIDAEQHR
jgi:hypothetical protein